MKTIRVDFSKKILKEICRQGEKNTAFLDFVLPADFAEADYVNAEFKKPSGKKETVELLDPAGVFVPMTEELTCEAGRIGIQLTAYKLEGDEIIEIAKSPIVYGVIERSLGGSHHAGESVIERIIAFINEWRDKLVEMWEKKHWHDNKEILDTITEETLEVPKPDWNDNDSESKNYITNRTHWKEQAISMKSYTVEWLSEAPPYSPQNWDSFNLEIELEEGKQYTLTVDGQTYTGECTKVEIEAQGENQVHLIFGNMYYANGLLPGEYDDNGFPMLLDFATIGADSFNIILTDSGLFGSDLPFSIGTEETVYHPLVSDYMPQGVKEISSVTSPVTTHMTFNGSIVQQQQIYNVAPSTLSDDYTIPWMYPGVWYRIGSKESPVRSITIMEFAHVDTTVAEEYAVELWTGATAPSPVIFPSNVEWPDGSEPVWAANKHYQVSIVGNMGLYAESDYGEEESS